MAVAVAVDAEARRCRSVASPRLTVIAPVAPLTVGAAPFNTAMAAALSRQVEVDVLSWSHPYPPLLYHAAIVDDDSQLPVELRADRLLAWHDPRSWRLACRHVAAVGADAVVLPWLHPVWAPPYRWLLRHMPRDVRRIVICHNVLPHERVPLMRLMTRAALREADVAVLHAPHQRAELAQLGLEPARIVDAFHPRFAAEELAARPSADAVAATRRRLGSPQLLLLTFGAVRPYKGVDLALEALALLPSELSVKLVVAGRFWEGTARFERQVARLGLENRVELCDRYVSNEEAALLFSACDAAVLPYRSASQSGVVALAFAYGRPVVVTAVGGLPAAVRDGEDALVVPPGDPASLAAAIARLPAQSARLTAGARRSSSRNSFDEYARLIVDAAIAGR